VRLLAEGRDPARTRVREVMRPEPPCAFEDEDAGHAAETMADEQISRLPVVSRGDRRFLGVVALADLAASRAGKAAAGRAERR
jgi:CBS domain-containing protein